MECLPQRGIGHRFGRRHIQYSIVNCQYSILNHGIILLLLNFSLAKKTPIERVYIHRDYRELILYFISINRDYAQEKYKNNSAQVLSNFSHINERGVKNYE